MSVTRACTTTTWRWELIIACCVRIFFRGIPVNQNAPKNGNQRKRGPLCVRDVPASSSAGIGHTHTHTRHRVSVKRVSPLGVCHAHTHLNPRRRSFMMTPRWRRLRRKNFSSKSTIPTTVHFSFRFSDETGSHVCVRLCVCVYVGVENE